MPLDLPMAVLAEYQALALLAWKDSTSANPDLEPAARFRLQCFDFLPFGY
jgi:hypothetical protein